MAPPELNYPTTANIPNIPKVQEDDLESKQGPLKRKKN